MKPLHLAVMGIVLSFVMWGSLFFTVLNQAHQTRQLLSIDNKLLAQQKQTLREQSRTITILNTKFDDLKNHDDCLFNLATQPNHSSAYIANAQTCAISSASGPVTSTPQPQKAATASSSPPTRPKVANQSNQATNPAPQVTPKPGLIKQFTNLLNL